LQKLSYLAHSINVDPFKLSQMGESGVNCPNSAKSEGIGLRLKIFGGGMATA
jgi:hypothetical protein